MNKGQSVCIVWNDAKIYSPQDRRVVCSVMQTTGVFQGELGVFYVVKNPTTIKKESGDLHPTKTPTFYLIPKVSVASMTLF